MTQCVRIGILGASGYTGAELVRLLSGHLNAEISVLTANQQAGQPMHAVYPHLRSMALPDLISWQEADWSNLDLAFCALPHGTSQEIVAQMPVGLKVVDLSADFRLRDVDTYAAWYGKPHQAPDHQDKAVYGLTEHNRSAIRQADLVACPGCYPTAALLALTPLLATKTADPADLIIDAKSGVTGAGRKVSQGLLFAEVGEGIHPYGVGQHRHAPEMEQELSRVAGAEVRVNFTPHLIPMNRGELVTCHVKLTGQESAADARAVLADHYSDEPYVRVLPEGATPATRHVRGSNMAEIGVYPDRLAGRAVVVAAIDNLVKGASGQAVQNMNAMLGLPETRGLELQPMFP